MKWWISISSILTWVGLGIFIALLVGLLVLGALLWFGKLTAGQFLIGFGVCVGGYKVANVLLTTLMPGIVNRNGGKK